jgi:hypothetical protein
MFAQDLITRITLRRTIRNESAYFLCQVLVLFSTTAAYGAVIPTAPEGAINYFYIASVCRMAISMILSYASIFDLRDRRRIHDERGRLQATSFKEYEASLSKGE